MCLRDGGALRSLGRQQSRATRRDQRAPVLNMFPPSDIHDRRRPSIKIWVDGLFGSSCPILGHLVRDRRAPPSRRRTDHDRSERTSPVPSSTSVVDARHPPPQMTMANSRAISCRFISRWFRRQYRLGVRKRWADSPRSSGQTLRNRCCYARVPVNHCVTVQLGGASTDDARTFLIAAQI